MTTEHMTEQTRKIGDVADALNSIASELGRIGIGNAASDMGGLEQLSFELKKGSERIADAICVLADAIREQGKPNPPQ